MVSWKERKGSIGGLILRDRDRKGRERREEKEECERKG